MKRKDGIKVNRQNLLGTGCFSFLCGIIVGCFFPAADNFVFAYVAVAIGMIRLVFVNLYKKNKKKRTSIFPLFFFIHPETATFVIPGRQGLYSHIFIRDIFNACGFPIAISSIILHIYGASFPYKQDKTSPVLLYHYHQKLTTKTVVCSCGTIPPSPSCFP